VQADHDYTMGQEKGETEAAAEKNPSKMSDEMHEDIIRKELDTAMNSLRKRIDNLKGVDVKFPRKPNPFRKNGG